MTTLLGMGNLCDVCNKPLYGPHKHWNGEEPAKPLIVSQEDADFEP